MRASGITALATLGGVVAYVAFQWGGVVRTGRYEYLLVLGLLAVVWSLAQRNDQTARPGRVLRWTVALLPAYALLQVVPLPVAVLRLVSPARGEMVDALVPIGA